MFRTTEKFIVLRDLEINLIDPEEDNKFEDTTMNVTFVPLRLPNDELLQR